MRYRPSATCTETNNGQMIMIDDMWSRPVTQGADEPVVEDVFGGGVNFLNMTTLKYSSYYDPTKGFYSPPTRVRDWYLTK